jgi:uncharacterized protein
VTSEPSPDLSDTLDSESGSVPETEASSQTLPGDFTHTPDYQALVEFLMGPLVSSPELLRVNCEVLDQRSRVLIRVAFESDDRGRVFGRGGRNIQAIRTMLAAAGQTVGYQVHLEVFGGEPDFGEDGVQRSRDHGRDYGSDGGGDRGYDRGSRFERSGSRGQGSGDGAYYPDQVDPNRPKPNRPPIEKPRRISPS